MLSARCKADRAAMAARVAELATGYGLAVVVNPEQPGYRKTSVDVAGPRGLKLRVSFDGTCLPDVFVLNWHGVEDGTRLHPGMFGVVNEYHGQKATDVARGFAQLERTLHERFAVIHHGLAFVSEVPADWTAEGDE